MKTCFVLALLLSGIATAQPAGTFTATGSMTTPRSGHTATLLPNGKVMIAGGGSATVELYDPSTGTFAATAARTASKFIGSATLLPDGRVLLIEAFGTFGPPNVPILYTRNAELYDPSTGTVTATGSMINGQRGYAATLLTNGKVLITGGSNGESASCCTNAANPELYDPPTQVSSLAGPYADTGARYAAAGLVYIPATLLPDGTVLIASESAAEIFDPATSKFRLTASMTAVGTFGGSFSKPDTLDGRTATLLLNGKVLLTGGDPGYGDFDTSYDFTLNTAELYDFLGGTFIPTGEMATGRYSHSATLLTNGTVLITGGAAQSTSAPVAELYNPSTGTFFLAGSMTSVRAYHQATLLGDGRVLITGGTYCPTYNHCNALPSAELYTPTVVAPAPALLSLSGDGKGQGAILHAGTPQVVSAGTQAIAGEALEIYCTGLADGGVIPPQVAIGGLAAEVLYFGNAPGYAGLNQVNVRVPVGVTPGTAVPVRFTYLGRPSNEVTIGVK
ncbi:MAG: hypothetical protein ABI995_04090 [Acidobacteriota bacterium]